MKINWGTGIAIFYSLFVFFMVAMVINSTQNKPNMVQDNYYEKDLNYEAFRGKRENAANAKGQIKIEYLADEKNILLDFPDKVNKVSGKVTFFRPSDKNLDKIMDIKLNADGQMIIGVDESLPRGLWNIQIDWQDQVQQFYTEESIVL